MVIDNSRTRSGVVMQPKPVPSPEDAEDSKKVFNAGEPKGGKMERYEIRSGTFDIVRYTDTCIVVVNKSIVFEGTYSECRRYIERQK